MALYTIADLHLSLGENTNKPMDVFGQRWQDYTEKIRKKWCAVVEEDDTVIIPGDISWAIKLEDSIEDFRFIESLPGKKIIGKGNHDFWWSTKSKIDKFFSDNGISTVSLLYNNAIATDECVISGTRGWYNESSSAPRPCDYQKITQRECMRLRMSLNEAKILAKEKNLPIVVFTHFPPVWKDFVFDELIDIMTEFEVEKCYYGHIHGVYNVPHITQYKGISFELISADYIDFVPKRVFFD